MTGKVAANRRGHRLGRIGGELRSAAFNARRVSPSYQAAVWRHGFFAGQATLFDFSQFGFDCYVSELERRTKLTRLNRDDALLGDKLQFFRHLSAVGVPTPRVFGFAHDGAIDVFEGVGRGDDRFRELLRRHGRLVVKPRDGSCGDGFALLERRGERVLVNGTEVRDVRAHVPDGTIVSEFVEQHAYAREIFPHSTNTLRMISLRDPVTGEPFVAAAAHRFGTARSRPVDNAAKGGLTAGVDLRTGTLSPLAAMPGSGPHASRTGGLSWYEAHPETRTQVAGTVVAHWAQAVDGVNRAMAALPGLDCIGWDVTITPDGFSILEGNDRPAIEFQIHGPLLSDERARRFFEHHGLRRRSEAASGAGTTAPSRSSGAVPSGPAKR